VCSKERGEEKESKKKKNRAFLSSQRGKAFSDKGRRKSGEE